MEYATMREQPNPRVRHYQRAADKLIGTISLTEINLDPHQDYSMDKMITLLHHHKRCI